MTSESSSEKKQATSQELKALIIAIVFLVGISVNLMLSISLGIRTGEWQQFARVGVILIFGGMTVVALTRIRRGRVESGIWLIISGILFALLGTEFFMVGFGPILALLELLLAGGVAFLVLPKDRVRGAFVFIIGSAILTFGLEFIPLNYRILAPQDITKALPIIAGLVVAAMIALFLRQIGHGSIRVKLLFAVFIILGFVVFFQTGVNLRLSRELSERAERDHLLFLYQGYSDFVDTQTTASAALSLSYADRDDIKELYLARDRDALLELLTPIFETLKNELSIRHLYIENPDGTVFVRIHNPEKHSDDVTYRYTAAAALNSKETVAGVEVGPGRIGIRSVSPLWDEGSFIGMVEVGLDYDQAFVDDFKERTNADYNLWITYEAAELPGLTPSDDTPLAPTEKVFHYASSSENLISFPISAETYDRILETGEPEILFISIEDEALAVLIAPMLAYPERVIGVIEIVQSRTETLEAINQNRRSILIPASLLTLIGLLVLVIVFNQVVLRPVGHMASVAEKQIAGDLSSRVKMLPPDEIGYLGKTLNSLSEQLDVNRKDQEKIIAERTKSLEERSAYLESSAEVSRAIASITNADELIKQVVRLIKERFDLYYVGLFIADQEHEWAILQAGTGEAGRIMLERKHRLKIGEGMIGWCVKNAQSRIALDVGEDAVRFNNPVLPETHSEGALPLRSRGRVLGALTIQSTETAAFTPEIITTLQTMADQVAIALDNAELLAQSEAALSAERKAYGQLSQAEWLALLHRQNIPRYVSDAPGHVHTIHDEPGVDLTHSLQKVIHLEDKGFSALIPIKVRGHIIGGVKLRKEEEAGVWTKQQLELAEILAEQVSVALENARLFDQSQRRAAQDRVIRESTARIRETLDIESVLKTAAQELHKILGRVETEVWIDAE